MKLLKPFPGLRPRKELASRVASHPYDVVNREEAAALAKDNPYSFFHINKPEIDVPESVDPHDPSVYQQGAENLKRFVDEGILIRDTEDKLYVYQQIMGEHKQVGLVAVASVAAYEQGLIKKHEFTRPDKEDDRVNHMDALDAQVGPVFLTYKADRTIDSLIAKVTGNSPEYDFTADDGTRHTFWVIEDLELAADLETAFDGVQCLYVADGHHRSAAASRVCHLRQRANPQHRGEESYNWFLTVVFPHDQMQILDYNRIVKDLGGRNPAQFLSDLEQEFTVQAVADHGVAKPDRAGQFGMYVGGQWYLLTAREVVTDSDDPVNSLDVSLLQRQILEPMLGIGDQRTDKRIDFVGGIRGLGELQKRVDSGQWAVAFALFPTSIESLMAIADAGEVMPPKSTWFEPKLKSGLIIHVLD
ncbi:MAG: DUF1015 family protein [Gammaproteobacteria bacterium]|nr:DUF1015 domain-containing protein [Pseudomonadales bacterium]MCP5346391.1 DUF1015 domain-containing protein [Pseudomonadales bacterium]